MVLSLHSVENFWNLGLIRIEGKTNNILSTHSLDISTRLNLFGISLEYLVAMMSDGASINAAISEETDLVQQKCFAHGVQLAVNLVLYNVAANKEDYGDSDDKDLVLRPKYFKMPTKSHIKLAMLSLIGKIKESVEPEGDDSVADEPTFQNKRNPSEEMDFYQKLEAKKMKPSTPKPSLDKLLALEMSTFDKTGQKGPLLQKNLLITQTIRPTSCDCERAFSIAGYFCSKLRSRLSDESLNSLCFLKSYFNNHYLH